MFITRASEQLLSTFSSPWFGGKTVYDYGHWRESLLNKSDEDIGRSFLRKSTFVVRNTDLEHKKIKIINKSVA
jgi:hypothetical protein